jgi:FKBP-type peptidyl-prolyl cis-trans isomerase
MERRPHLHVLVPLLLVGLLASCSRGPFNGFKPVGMDVHMKLRILGEGEVLPTDSDSVLMRVRMARHEGTPGSLFSTERWYSMQVDGSGFLHLLPGKMHTGDSVSVIAKGARLPWAQLGATTPAGGDTLWIDVELALLAIRTPADSRRMAHERLMARTQADEEAILGAYLKRDSTTVWKEFMGLRYILDPANPKRSPIHSGDQVTIHYTAHFLDNGRVFDDTYRSAQPLTFRLGDPGQVIKGLEVAAHLLPPGGKGRFLIPSALAFGSTGSTGGIVPPFTPVLYTVEVVSVTARPAPVTTDSAAVVP